MVQGEGNQHYHQIRRMCTGTRRKGLMGRGAALTDARSSRIRWRIELPVDLQNWNVTIEG